MLDNGGGDGGTGGGQGDCTVQCRKWITGVILRHACVQ